MTEEEFAKIAFAQLIRAIREIREDMSTEEGEKFVIHFPDSIKVNETTYSFTRLSP